MCKFKIIMSCLFILTITGCAKGEPIRNGADGDGADVLCKFEDDASSLCWEDTEAAPVIDECEVSVDDAGATWCAGACDDAGGPLCDLPKDDAGAPIVCFFFKCE
jgi:hypothetical protein